MSIVTDAIAAFTANLTRIVDAPTGDLGFGSDLSCTDDITADAAEIDGDSVLAVAQSNYRRLITPRGMVQDDPDYGTDLCTFLHEPMTQQRQQEVIGIIRSELLKDDRNETIDVTVVAATLRTLALAVNGTTATGDFSLTMALTDGQVLLKELVANGNA